MINGRGWRKQASYKVQRHKVDKAAVRLRKENYTVNYCSGEEIYFIKEVIGLHCPLYLSTSTRSPYDSRK